jgi:hypothetical protein
MHYVIIPYSITSIYGIHQCIFKLNKPATPVWFSEAFSDWSIPQKILALYLSGSHLFPFWFIPMISIFYLIAPFLVWIDQVPNRYWLLLLLLPLSLIVPRPADFDIVQSFIHFLPVYVLGMFSSRYRTNILDWHEKNFLYSAAIILLLLIGEFYQRLWLSDFSGHFAINTLNKEVQCLLLLYFLWRIDSLLSSRTHLLLGFLANFSFGIYFLHGYVMNSISVRLELVPLIGSWLRSGNLITFTIFVVITLTISSFIIFLIKKAFKDKSRYICGC